jgi:hypothetical protein
MNDYFFIARRAFYRAKRISSCKEKTSAARIVALINLWEIVIFVLYQIMKDGQDIK